MTKKSCSAQKILGLLLGIYIAVFIAVVIPFHHHDRDSRVHDDCSICAAVNRIIVPAANNTFQFIPTIIFLITISGIIRVKNHLHESCRLRGPPL